jgi:hypothetical protein
VAQGTFLVTESDQLLILSYILWFELINLTRLSECPVDALEHSLLNDFLFTLQSLQQIAQMLFNEIDFLLFCAGLNS